MMPRHRSGILLERRLGGVHRYVTLIAAQGRIFVVGDDRVYAVR
jgi:hypothetical protein